MVYDLQQFKYLNILISHEDLSYSIPSLIPERTDLGIKLYKQNFIALMD